jgi:hypothetical protein
LAGRDHYCGIGEGIIGFLTRPAWVFSGGKTQAVLIRGK